jgi:hypothetical protein
MGDEGRRGERGGGIYILSIGGARLMLVSITRSLIGDLECGRPPINCSDGFLGLYVYESIADGNSDSRRRGTCDAGIDRLC